MSQELTRRDLLRRSIGGLAGLGLGLAAGGRASAEGAAPLPKGKIGKLNLSRMILGGNLLAHFTHSRDLQYVYNLATHYNTKEKILETLAEAEARGIDALTIHTAPGIVDLLKEYREKRGGKIRWIICSIAPVEEGLAQYGEEIRRLVGDGTDAIYFWGVRADELVKQGKVGLIAKAVDLARGLGVPSGLGAHELAAIAACEKAGIAPDFYLKTLHHHGYPSSKLNHDSMWCAEPQETIEFMKTVEKPWIAFKTMAAGAIPPRDAFRYAVEGGADFVLAGMFDYEIAEDVGILKEVLGSSPKRARPWRG